MHNPEFVSENEMHKILWDFDIQTDHLILARRPDLVIVKKKKKIENLSNSELCCPSRPLIKLKKDTYMGLARELKKLWNMKVTVISIVTGILGTVTKGLVQGLENLEMSVGVETIEATTLLRSARILRRVLETWGDLLSFRLQWKSWREKLPND